MGASASVKLDNKSLLTKKNIAGNGRIKFNQCICIWKSAYLRPSLPFYAMMKSQHLCRVMVWLPFQKCWNQPKKYFDELASARSTQKLVFIHVTNFSSISYYRSLRLISKIDLVRNIQSIVNQKSMFHLKLPPPPCISNQTHITPFPENRPIINSKEHLIKKFNSPCVSQFLWLKKHFWEFLKYSHFE